MISFMRWRDGACGQKAPYQKLEGVPTGLEAEPNRAKTAA
jgi:hypothetical protein